MNMLFSHDDVGLGGSATTEECNWRRATINLFVEMPSAFKNVWNRIGVSYGGRRVPKPLHRKLNMSQNRVWYLARSCLRNYFSRQQQKAENVAAFISKPSGLRYTSRFS